MYSLYVEGVYSLTVQEFFSISQTVTESVCGVYDMYSFMYVAPLQRLSVYFMPTVLSPTMVDSSDNYIRF